MKAYRNLNGQIVEIDVDVDPNNQPLLPPDTTVDPRPDPLAGHYVTIVGNAWVQIEIPATVFEFSYNREKKLADLAVYKTWYLDQPLAINGVLYDADEQARTRLIQALTVYNAYGALPSAWVDSNNVPHPISAVADLNALIQPIAQAFQTRFFDMDTIRQNILAVADGDQAALDLIVVPTIPQTV